MFLLSLTGFNRNVELLVLISLNKYMQNKIWKSINPENFLRNAKQEFPCQNLKSFSGEYYNMEKKILDFQFGPLCANQTRPNYSVGSDQDEAEIQYDR